MVSHLSLVIRSSALSLVIGSVALAVAACGSDETTTGSSSGSSGSSGASGTTGTSGGGGTVVVPVEDSGTTAPGNGGECTRVSTCEGALCKCADGPNKDKSCQKTDKALANYCDKLCEICK